MAERAYCQVPHAPNGAALCCQNLNNRGIRGAIYLIRTEALRYRLCRADGAGHPPIRQPGRPAFAYRPDRGAGAPATLVEMGGVEPPSRKVSRRHATSLVNCLLSLADAQPTRRPLSQPADLSPA